MLIWRHQSYPKSIFSYKKSKVINENLCSDSLFLCFSGLWQNSLYRVSCSVIKKIKFSSIFGQLNDVLNYILLTTVNVGANNNFWSLYQKCQYWPKITPLSVLWKFKDLLHHKKAFKSFSTKRIQFNKFSLFFE